MAYKLHPANLIPADVLSPFFVNRSLELPRCDLKKSRDRRQYSYVTPIR